MSNKGLAKANPNIPLVPGFRNEKVAEPLAHINQKVDDVIADINTLNRQFGESTNSIINSHLRLQKDLVNISNAAEALIVLFKEAFPDKFDERFESARSAAALARMKREEREFDLKNGYADVADAVQVGDMVVADIYLKNPETKDTLDRFEYAPFLVGRNKVFPDFDSNFLGMNPGESKKVEGYVVPDAHEFAGVKLDIDILIHKVKRAKVKETTNEVSKSVQ